MVSFFFTKNNIDTNILSTAESTYGSNSTHHQGYGDMDETRRLTPYPSDDNNDNAVGNISISVNIGDANKRNSKFEEPTMMRNVPGSKNPNQRKDVLRRIGSLIVLLVIQVGIPLALYYGLRDTIGVVYSLVISGIPPFLYVIYEFIKNRRIDVLGCIIALSFVLSGVISIVSGDARAALIRDSAVGAVIGGLFLVTLLPIRTKWIDVRPLTFIIGQQIIGDAKCQWLDRDGVPQEQLITHWTWDHVRFLRISMYAQTAAWGILLVLEMVICVLFVEESTLSVDQIVMHNNIISLVVLVVMTTVSIVSNIICHKIVKRVGKEWVAENDFTDKFSNQQSQQNQTDIVDEEHTLSNFA